MCLRHADARGKATVLLAQYNMAKFKKVLVNVLAKDLLGTRIDDPRGLVATIF